MTDAVKMAIEALRQDRNEAIMALTAKFGPILKAAFPNEHSRARFDVANALAEVALATPSQPDPKSRVQAFDGEGEVAILGWASQSLAKAHGLIAAIADKHSSEGNIWPFLKIAMDAVEDADCKIEIGE